ncbi:NADH-quinone oxidoreductase subunit L [Nibribacter ruber]|uniref:NADH-quinone oxidoreductase subunit L n=1 Tax=Nibribacter ruber TaxID=2698458 RepID=A0A6P1P460_9BACT|nr:NADH-quinone oxidoreductase subunit L [Nibribacter ruber]QHL89173.1 NADH-quinone oxidoreductase subunit L [Nibribacter ruber]
MASLQTLLLAAPVLGQSLSLLERVTVAGLLVMPLLSFLTLFLLGKRLPRHGDWLAIGFMFLSLTGALFLFGQVWGQEPLHSQFTWFTLPGSQGTILAFDAGVYLDNLTVVMLVVVTFISFLVMVFSLGYMKGDALYARYYAYLSLFTACMLGLLLADNLLVLFICWELVGFLSYLLIGFWYQRQAAAKASTKAFLVNRIGDVGFLWALFAFYGLFHSFSLQDAQGMLATLPEGAENGLLLLLGFGLLVGAMGKSAQFPLQVWLPDAMQGPTPVSALIHAATMVAAGVYLLARCFPFFVAEVLLTMALVGAFTALLGALAASQQQDIKKVLAFSTVSQLGYMVMGVGIGAPEASLFHLLTHAFFKAALFLLAGILIHAVQHAWQHHSNRILFEAPIDVQDMRNMGGLRLVLPITFICYLITAGALVGLPFFSGFLSKEALLQASVQWAQAGSSGRWFIPAVGFLTVMITAYYMGRQVLLVFFGRPRLQLPIRSYQYSPRQEVAWSMLGPVLVLTLLSFWLAFSWSPVSVEQSWLMQDLPAALSANTFVPSGEQKVHFPWLAFLSVGMVLLGGALAYFTRHPVLSKEKTLPVYGWRYWLKNQFFMNEAYSRFLVKPTLFLGKMTERIDQGLDYLLHAFSKGFVALSKLTAWADRWVVDGVVQAVGWLSRQLGHLGRSLQNGNIQSYYLFSLLGLVVLLFWLFY